VDTGLRGFPVCLLRGDVSDRGVHPPLIVGASDVSESIAPRGCAIGMVALMDDPGFQGAGEAFPRHTFSLRFALRVIDCVTAAVAGFCGSCPRRTDCRGPKEGSARPGLRRWMAMVHDALARRPADQPGFRRAGSIPRSAAPAVSETPRAGRLEQMRRRRRCAFNGQAGNFGASGSLSDNLAAGAGSR
jgi:hypothetical protein